MDKRDLFIYLIPLVLIAVLLFVLTRRDTTPILEEGATPSIEVTSEKKEQNNMQDQAQGQAQEQDQKAYVVTLTTSKGDITIELNSDQTPLTVENFVKLSKEGFYDDTVFHRIIDGFMIQGGDPTGTGTGGPGYKFDDEPFDGEYTRGTVAMANSGPNTNGSQFFIMHKDTPLPKDYVIFGKVTAGLEVVDAIATAETAPNAFGEASTPVSPDNIMSVDVQEK